MAFATLGCKVNQYDTQALSELFVRFGFDVVGFDEAADVYVVNTCAVTAAGDRKSRQVIRRAVRRARGQAAVMVTGCLAQLRGEALAAMEGVSAVVGTDRRRRLVDLALQWVATRQGRFGGEVEPPTVLRRRRPGYEELPIASFADRSRAVVKVQDGCDEMCSFCIVPYTRGAARSRRPEAVVDEVRRLVDRGYRELVLSGVHLGAYGKDLGDGTTLTRLLERIEEVPGQFRVRLSSLLPASLTEELVAAWGRSGRLCPHLHLSLQSGDDAVLRAMGRRYTADEVRRRVGRLREAVPDLAISCDIIVGFPGETDPAFERTARLLEELGAMRLHLFPFSPRPGTRAARLGGGVPVEVVRRRMQALQALEDRLALAFHRTLEGRDVEVLVEQPEAEAAWPEGVDGHYVRVELPGLPLEALEPGHLVRATVTEAGRHRVRAVLAGSGGGQLAGRKSGRLAGQAAGWRG